MDSGLSDEEFQRLQTQLLELKTNNYALEEDKRRHLLEISQLRQRVDELDKQLSRLQTVNKINPLSLARNIANKVDNKLRDKDNEHLMIENENLIRKIESQEQEFTVTNQTLKEEIHSLIATNDALKKQLNSFHLPNDCDLGVKSTIRNEDNCETKDNIITISTDSNANPLSFAILAEKEKLELKVYDLQDLVNKLQKEKQLFGTEMQELRNKLQELENINKELSDCNDIIERQNSLIEEMREHKTSIELKFKTNFDELRAEHQINIESLESNIRVSEETKEELEKKISELIDKLNEMESIRKENDKMINEVDSYKEELSFCRTQSEETIERLEKQQKQHLEEFNEKYTKEIELIRQECNEYVIKIFDLEKQIKDLNQKIVDGIEDRKIHEKKGVLMVKELKRQLNSERKRADKLQERLRELLNESTSSISTDIQRKQSHNGNDSSSVGSWSFMSAKDNNFSHNRSMSIHSVSSDGRESATSPVNPVVTVDETINERNGSLLEKENNELLSRIASLQQEKWILEEKLNQLELSINAMNEDISRKTDIIQYYSMEGRSTRPNSQQSILHNSDKLTVKRVVDFIKDKGDESMREINRKVQRMLEETLTKNMHLQQNLDSLSQEVVRLNDIIDNNTKISSFTSKN